MGLEFRAASRQDIAIVLANETAAYEVPWGKQALIDSLAEQYQFWVVENTENARVVGHLIYQLVADESHLLNICVHPREQGRGFGKVIMGFWFENSLAAGCSNLWLEVRNSNLVAQKLYQSLGFEVVSKRKNYYPLPGNSREDGLIMSRKLSKAEQ